MGRFFIEEPLYDDDFNMLLLLANSDAPLTFLRHIEDATFKLKNSRILIDQILHSGNTHERFIAVDLENGKVVKSSMCFIGIPKDSNIREISRNLLCDNSLIEFSILSSIQKKMLYKGLAI